MSCTGTSKWTARLRRIVMSGEGYTLGPVALAKSLDDPGTAQDLVVRREHHALAGGDRPLGSPELDPNPRAAVDGLDHSRNVFPPVTDPDLGLERAVARGPPSNPVDPVRHQTATGQQLAGPNH